MVLSLDVSQEPEDQEYFSQFVTLPAVRRAIHVGNLTFHNGSEVEKHLLQDVMKSIKPWLGVLMDNYRVRGVSDVQQVGETSRCLTVVFVQVLMYSGQLDVIVAAPLTERFLPTVNWTGADEYKTTPRFPWKVQPSDTEVAGYVRQTGEFYQVSTRPGPFKQRARVEVLNSLYLPACNAGHHTRRRTHSAVRPTSKIL